MSNDAAAGNAAAAAAAPTPAQPLSNHESFMLLVSDPAGVAALLDYLKAGYSEHHLVFWQEVQERYRRLPSTTDPSAPARNKLAEDMWHRYGKNGSQSQINITEPQRLRLQTAIEKIGQVDAASGAAYGAPVDLFDESAAHCLELIKGNYFFPFQSSKQYAGYKVEKKAKEEKEAAAALLLASSSAAGKRSGKQKAAAVGAKEGEPDGKKTSSACTIL